MKKILLTLSVFTMAILGACASAKKGPQGATHDALMNAINAVENFYIEKGKYPENLEMLVGGDLVELNEIFKSAEAKYRPNRDYTSYRMTWVKDGGKCEWFPEQNAWTCSGR